MRRVAFVTDPLTGGSPFQLRDVGDGKEQKRGMNHVEKNIFKGRTNTATLTELVILCLYCQTSSTPFVEYIHDP